MLLRTLTVFTLLLTPLFALPIEDISSAVTEAALAVELSTEDAVSTNMGGVGSTSCYGSGATMSRGEASRGIGRFCEEKNNWYAAKNFELGVWLNVMDLNLSDGRKGVLHLGYMNQHGAEEGWKVIKGECYEWMNAILNNCVDGSGNTRGGRYLTSSGYLWLDPNANWWDVVN